MAIEITIKAEGRQALANLEKLRQALADVDRSASTSGARRELESLNRMGYMVGREFGSTLRLLGVTGAFVGGGLVAGIVGAGKALADFGQEGLRLHYLSQELGVSTEALQRWGLAGQAAGNSAETAASDVQGAMKKLQDLGRRGGYAELYNQLVQAGAGTTGRRLAEELYNEVKSGGTERGFQFLMDTLARYAKEGNTWGITAIEQVFGLSGKGWQLAPELIARIGSVATVSAKDALEFQLNITLLGAELNNFKTTVGNDLLPVFTQMARALREWLQGPEGQAFQKSITDMAKRLQDLPWNEIRAGVTTTLGGLGTLFGEMMKTARATKREIELIITLYDKLKQAAQQTQDSYPTGAHGPSASSPFFNQPEIPDSVGQAKANRLLNRLFGVQTGTTDTPSSNVEIGELQIGGGEQQQRRRRPWTRHRQQPFGVYNLDLRPEAPEVSPEEMARPRTFWDRVNPFDPRNVQRDQELHPGQYRGGDAAGNNSPQRFTDMSGGESDGRTRFQPDPNFLGGSPLSTNVEDRRATGDLTDQMRDVTDEVRRLNDLLREGGDVARVPGGGAGGMGDVGGGGAAGGLRSALRGRMGGGGGGGGGGGDGDGGAGRYAGFEKGGTGGGGAITMADIQGAVRGGGGEAGEGGSQFLADARASRIAEINANPTLKREVLGMLRAESGDTGTRGMTATFEALIDRSRMVGNTVSQELHSGFYSSMKGKAQRMGGDPTPGKGGKAEQAINAAAGGSFNIRGRTDQGMVGDPNWRGPGRVNVPGSSEIYNFWKGKRRGRDFTHEDSQRFAEEQERQVLAERNKPAGSTETATADVPLPSARPGLAATPSDDAPLAPLGPRWAGNARKLAEQLGGGNIVPGSAGKDVPPLRSHGNAGDLNRVDPRLREIVAAATKHLPPGYTASVFSGKREGRGGSQHNIGRALDVQIYDEKGNEIRARGPDTTGVYTAFHRAAYGEMLARYPDLKGRLASGTAFGTSSRNPNEPDLMHIDIGGERGRLGPQLTQMGALPGRTYGDQGQETAVAFTGDIGMGGRGGPRAAGKRLGLPYDEDEGGPRAAGKNLGIAKEQAKQRDEDSDRKVLDRSLVHSMAKDVMKGEAAINIDVGGVKKDADDGESKLFKTTRSKAAPQMPNTIGGADGDKSSTSQEEE